MVISQSPLAQNMLNNIMLNFLEEEDIFVWKGKKQIKKQRKQYVNTDCINRVSTVVIKIPWSTQSREKRVYLGWWFQRVKCIWQRKGVATGARGEGSHLEVYAGTKKSQIEIVWIFKLSKSTFSDTLLPARSLPLSLHKQCHQFGTRYSNIWAYQQHSHSKYHI